jgi:DNA-directed RNA polymerase III subunit RPC3
LASEGSVTASQLAQRVSEEASIDEQIPLIKIHEILQALVSRGFIRRLRPSHLQILHDVHQNAHFQIQNNPQTGESKSKGKKAQEAHVEQVKTELEQRLDSYLSPNFIDLANDTASTEDAALAPNGHHAVRSLGHSGGNSNSNDTQEEIYLCIDFTIAVKDLRQRSVSQLVEKALGPTPAKVAYAAVAQAGLPSPFDEKSADVLRPALPQALSISRIRKALQDNERLPLGDGIHHTNGYHDDAHITNGTDEAHEDNSAIVNGHSNLETSLSLIAEGPFPFLARDPVTACWNINSITLARWLRDKEITKIISERIGPVGLRIMRMLSTKGKLDEKSLQELGLLGAKDLRQTMARLQTMGLIELQEVPREPQRQPNRTMFFWFWDAERVKKVLLGELFKTMGRLYEVLKKEREEPMKGTLEKVERIGDSAKPEDHLIAEECTSYVQWRRKEMWLTTEIGRLDDSVALLRDM